MENRDSKYIILITVLVFFAGGILFLSSRKPLPPTDVKIMDFPLKIGDWTGKKEPPEQNVIDILGTDKILMMEFTGEKNQKVLFSVVYGEDNRLSFHPPENCYLGSGKTELLSKTKDTVHINEKMELEVNRVIFQVGQSKQLVLYWYMAGDRMTASYYKQQFFFILDQIRERKGKGALIRVATIIRREDGEEEAYKTLNEFMNAAIPLLEKYI
ncbi:MAG: EpsI family protein [Candidatus Aureabacteria bacterium]|nr:EpsI family protein [Candidatus Auribacterota bacterium]